MCLSTSNPALNGWKTASPAELKLPSDAAERHIELCQLVALVWTAGFNANEEMESTAFPLPATKGMVGKG